MTLIVERDGEEIVVPGRLMANRFYYNDQGRQALGLGGPDRLLPEVDENGNRLFDGSWAGWYEDKTGPKPAGDRETWQTLFAEWRFIGSEEGEPSLYDPDYDLRPSNFESAWQDSRRLITGDVYDARVARVERPRLLYEPGEGDPIPRVESVPVILDHVGLIDGEYHRFTNIDVHRVWRLQRLDGGPWKITDVQRL